MNGLAHAAAPPIAGAALDNKRVAAALIDLVVLVVVAFLMGTLSGSYTTGARLVTVGWALFYYFALELITGQTLGKKLMGLRVAQVDGSPPEMRQVAMRTVLRLVDGLGVYLVGLITMLATGQRRQRLGDLAAGTIVTTAEEEPAEGDDFENLADADAPVVPLPLPDAPATPPPAPVPAVEPPPAAEPPPAIVPPFAMEKEPPAFEPYTVPEPPAPAPEPEPVEPPPPAAVEPRIELVPDPPAEGEKPRIKIVSPIDLVMGEDEDEDEDKPSSPLQPA